VFTYLRSQHDLHPYNTPVKRTKNEIRSTRQRLKPKMPELKEELEDHGFPAQRNNQARMDALNADD
jgi:hypothetical protein